MESTMAKPFTLSLLPGVVAPRLKPGWHKRALASEKAAASRRKAMAPQYGNGIANEKAVEYAIWLARRDGVALPEILNGKVEWESCEAGMRPRFVLFLAKDVEPVRIELPHWSYVTPEAVELPFVEWTAPVVAEVTGEARAAVLAALAEHDAALWVEAVAGAYAAPVAWEIPGTDPEAELIPFMHELPAPMLIPALTIVAEYLNVPAATETYPALVLSTETRLSTERDNSGTISTDAREPSAETHPIVALCLSHKAREALFSKVQDGTFPAETGKAAAGAWRLTLEDAKALQDVGSIRLVGMPRKPYTRRAAAPVVSSMAIHVPAFGGLTISHHGDRAAVYHSPSL
jgi:hypothetical protein